jgi:hypothetical protein
MKTKSKLLAFLFIFCVGYSQAQEKIKGNKEVTIEDRQLNDFHSIEIVDDFLVEILYNENQSVAITADSNLHQYISTVVENGVLTLKISENVIRSKSLTATIKVNKNLLEINGYNKAKIESKNMVVIDSLTINAFDNSDFNLKLNSKSVSVNSKKTSSINLNLLSDNLFIRAEESSKIDLNLNAKNVRITALDKASIAAQGTANLFEIEAQGNSSFKGKSCQFSEALVNASNGSKISVNALENLTILARNASEIFIYGTPKISLMEFFDKAILYKKE